jgi:molybdopterin synthase catalytic subunit
MVKKKIMTHKKRNPFVEGRIEPDFIAKVIAGHSNKTEAGAHSIFLGQVRADVIDGKTVQAIEYTAYPELAETSYHEIREAIFAKYPLTCLHVHHSLGAVGVGEICLFVMTTAVHRAEAADACREMVELIKHKLPVWGKEIFEGEGYQWKVNQ